MYLYIYYSFLLCIVNKLNLYNIYPVLAIIMYCTMHYNNKVGLLFYVTIFNGVVILRLSLDKNDTLVL